MTATIELRNVAKHFGGVRAVDDVSLDIHSGEVLGLLGHNGAGKSTLVGTLSGAYPCDAGEVRIDGTAVRIRTPAEARRLGIETLYQDLALADNLDATANLFLGRERLTPWGTLDEAAMERAARDTLARLNPRFDAFSVPVARLSGGQRQAIAIARAVHFDARVLILDEPTAALGPGESRAVAALIDRLKEAGVAIIVVSHDLKDVHALADRVAVMHTGRVVAVRRADEMTADDLVDLVVRG